MKIRPNSIVNCGEGIINGDKKYIEKIFKVSMVNLYGLAEFPILGVGRINYKGIYLMDDLELVEMKNDHLILTNLYNTAQPLIRYRINDSLVKKHNKQKILPFTLISEVLGRNESLIWLENDGGKMDFIHPIVIAEFYVPGLDKIQLIINDKKSFEFFAVISNGDNTIVINKSKREIPNF